MRKWRCKLCGTNEHLLGCPNTARGDLDRYVSGRKQAETDNPNFMNSEMLKGYHKSYQLGYNMTQWRLSPR